MAISLNTAAAQLRVSDSSVVEALALRSGQVVEARVANSGPGGAAQIVIANRSIDISAALKLQEGALIRLLVQGAGQNTRFTVLPPAASTQAVSHANVRHAPIPLSQHPASASQAQSAQASAQSAGGPSPRPVAVPQPGASGQPHPSPTQSITTGSTGTQAQPVSVNGNVAPTIAQAPSQISSAQPSSTASVSGAATPVSTPQTGTPAPLEPGTILRIDRQVSQGRIQPILVPDGEAGSSRIGRQGGTASPQALQGANLSPLQQAVQHTAKGAVVRQDSITTLLSSLAGLGARLASLPKPVAQAGSELLGARIPLDGKPLDGAALKQAFNRSGILYESSLLKNTGQAPPKGDIKANLLNLRTALRAWLGSEVEPKLPAANRPPPPTPGAPPRADRPTPPQAQALPPNTETGSRLLGQTEAALARTRLTQISSLPDGLMRAGQPSSGPAELNIELPLVFGGEMSVGQFQILRDGAHGSEHEQDDEWKMRFSIHFTQTGEVGATVSLRGDKTHVMLWAERDDTAETLKEALGELEQALEARGLKPGTLKCRAGHLPQGNKPVGAFMDNCS
ncbi:MAG: flagellar hook-length control protein FliK [Hyphomicrobiaceae bacterium]|nr:flagellar hook-length control protein FliK [Hyphomicrobiaceae bacterium]